MKVTCSLRWLLTALLLSVLSASAYAGVFISVGFAPPPLPVYEQPPCPEPGLMWTPGYWAYGDDGYYWVPGTWVPAPEPGYLWTPPYWGWDNGLYIFHRGYWGPHVGYYGGVNCGFGYGGIGFVGGEWRGEHFAYNTAVMHLGFHGGMTFFDRGRVDRGFVARDSRIAFSGGPGGIRHDRGPDEWRAEREHHMDVTRFQHSHEDAARGDRSSYFRNNNGRPAHMAADRPFGSEMHGPAQQHDFHQNDRGNPNHGNFNAPNSRPQFEQQPHQDNRGGGNPPRDFRSNGDRNIPDHGNMNGPGRPQPTHDNWQAPQSRPQFQQQPHQDNRGGGNPPRDFHSNGMNGQPPQNHTAPQFRQAPQNNPAPQFHQAPQNQPAPQFRQAPQSRPAQQPRPEPQRNAAPPAQRPAPPQQSEQPRNRDEHRQH